MTKVEQTSAAGQASQPQMVQPQAKAEKDIKIFGDMTLDDVEKNGSEAQKIVAAAFDFNELNEDGSLKKGDGRYSQREADRFNDYSFSLDKENKELKAINKKTGGVVTIKYSDLKELKEHAALVLKAGDMKGNITINLASKTALYEDIECPTLLLSGDDPDETITVRNADLGNIIANHFHGTLKLENVADVGIIFDSKAQVWIAEDTKISASEDCKIELIRK